MKKIKYLLFAGLFGFMLTACEDLDLEPKGILDEAALLGNEFGVKKYLSGIYNYAPIEDYVYSPTDGFRYDNYWPNANTISAMCGEMTGQYWGCDGAEGFNDYNKKFWPYDRIRDINVMIEAFPKYKENYTEPLYNSLLGEAHFLRAFYYFALVKRYGGIPIVKEVQDPTADMALLRVPRNKEVDVYKFIYDDLDFAINNMTDTKERGRANKYVAAALMSRAMLYAGSIAKYGQYANLTGDAVTEGFVGIPSSEAEWFFQKSYDASVLVDEGKYALYNKIPSDKEQNYVDLFLDLDSPEDIFIKEYDVTSPHNNRLKHSFDATHLPNPTFSSENEAAAYPVLDMVELFQELPIVNPDGTPRRFTNRKDMYAGLEPRMLATFYFSGMTLREGQEEREFDIQRGLYKTFNVTADEAQLGSTGAPINNENNRILAGSKDAELYDYNGTKFRINGEHGYWNGGHANNSRTGLYVRKQIDYKKSTKEVKLYNSDQPWKVFRYAEILLNRAEAAYELGLLKGDAALKSEAFDMIAKIRERAEATPHPINGAPADLTNKYSYPLDENLQFIREERGRELCFENHRWWDIRRWRSGDTDLNEFLPKVLMCYNVLDEVTYDGNGNRINSYIFLRENEPWNKRFNFQKKHFYEPIPGAEINKNPNLNPQNPIY